MTLYDDVITILRTKDIKAFIPILGSGRLFTLDKGDLFSLVVDPELNLLKMIIFATNNYDSELKKYDKKYFYNVDGFLLFDLHQYTFQDLRESVFEILNDSEIEDFSILVYFHIIRSLDYETLLRFFSDPVIFKRFLDYLLQNYNRDEEWQNYGMPPFSPYYENIGFHLTEALKESVIEMIREFDISLPLMINTLKWFQFFSPEQLKNIQGIISEKILETNQSFRQKGENLLRSLDGKIQAYERGLIKKPDREEVSFVVVNDLKYFVHESSLNLCNLGIKDISEVEGLNRLTELKELDLSDNQLQEINGLDNLVNLNCLYIKRNKLTEIKGLECLILLVELDLFHNEISEIKDLDNLEFLQRLNLGHNKITEIKGLEKLRYLEQLFLYGNQISEIRGLQTLRNLRILNINNNNITEIKGLESFINLHTLILSHNQITEIKGLDSLKDLKRLLLEDNQITEVKGLQNVEWFKDLNLGDNKIPKNLIEELGGFDKYGRVKEPQNFIEYCRKHLSFKGSSGGLKYLKNNKHY